MHRDEVDSNRHGDGDGDKDRGDSKEVYQSSTTIEYSQDIRGVEKRSKESALSSSRTGGRILVFKSFQSIEPEREKDTVGPLSCIHCMHF
jgi:hypothetical protein